MKIINVVIGGSSTPTTTDVTFNGELVTLQVEGSPYNVISSDIDTDKVNLIFEGNIIELNKCYKDERIKTYSGTILIGDTIKVLNMIVMNLQGTFTYALIVNSL